MTYQALCQDCLRAPIFDTNEELQQAHDGKVLCTCGGDLCACPQCLETLDDLKDGNYEGRDLKLITKVKSWSAHGGIVFDGEAS